MDFVSPRDRFITLYGRKPVLEALTNPEVRVDKVVLAENVHGASAQEILDAAASQGVQVQRATPQRVKLLAGNGKQDQGVVADVEAQEMRPLTSWLDADPPHGQLLLLDAITTPANVGMILRTVTAAGLEGVIVPHRGVARLDPLVVKASAGVALRAPILRTTTSADAAEALVASGVPLIGLAASAPVDLFEADLPDPGVFVLGGESGGISDAVKDRVSRWIAVPMAAGVESLNVASAAAVLCFELVRRRRSGRDGIIAST